jgi:hypothetical protein
VGEGGGKGGERKQVSERGGDVGGKFEVALNHLDKNIITFKIYFEITFRKC